MKLYLSGGFISGWQDEVKEVLGQFDHIEYLDPRLSPGRHPRDYTKQNLQDIDSCDIVLAYMEVNNPGWPNMAFEIGYAYAKNKKIVLVNKKTRTYVEMLHAVSDNFPSLDAALAAMPMMKEFR